MAGCFVLSYKLVATSESAFEQYGPKIMSLLPKIWLIVGIMANIWENVSNF